VSQRSIRVATVAMVLVLLLCGVLVAFESAIVPEVVVQRLRRAAPATVQLTTTTTTTTSETSHKDDEQYDELMTPELIAEIESRQSNEPISPMQVHLIWIGDIAKAPPSMKNYTDLGYHLTVHTSAEEILDGFHPYVLRAFNLAVPAVVGFDFLKFILLYKYGGIVGDGDTSPARLASEIKYPMECDVIFGKENFIPKDAFTKPMYRKDGVGKTYPFNRPFQVLNWAMAASKPRNPHVKRLIEMAMMHFFGLRDMEFDFIQDVAGSGLTTDYMALLHEREGRSYQEVYSNSTVIPVRGACLTSGYLSGHWIKHDFHGSWKE